MKKLRPIALWVGVLAVVAFVLLYVEADLLWKVQQHNVFLNTSLFFHQQMVVPGGMLSYLGAFFTQHFYYPWVGVVLICCWWLLLMWLTKRAFCIPEKWWVLTLIPVAILLLANMQLGYWVYVIKLRGFFYVATLGVTAGTALLWAFRKLPDKQWLRATFIMLATLVGYPLMGVYALFAVLLMGCLVWRQKASRTTQVILSVTALLSVVFIPLLFYRFVYYETNLNDIYAAALPDFTIVEHYSDYDIPYYVLAAYFLLLTFLCGRAWKAPKHPVMQWVKLGCVLAAVAGCLYYLWYKDDNFHHELRMQRCVEEADWEGVLEEGRKQDCEPTRAIVVMHNLALSRLGRQCDEMYNFRKGSKKVNTPLPIYMYHIAGRLMLYQYGILNECHRICMEDGVEYGWNVEQLKYLARCAILGGEKQAARKFLDILRQTCYYGSWALQGLYAIGSGGLFGKGLGESMQKYIVPEAQNDMIFSIICEELGVFGAVCIILLYILLLYRLLFIANHAKDMFGSYICIGIMAHIAIQVILNIAVVTNSMPNTGVTLPLISYGGTSVAILLTELGLALSVSKNMEFKEDEDV